MTGRRGYYTMRKVLQIMPAGEWHGVWHNHEGGLFSGPLIGWALVATTDYESGSDLPDPDSEDVVVEGLTSHGREVNIVTEDGNFMGYNPGPVVPGSKDEADWIALAKQEADPEAAQAIRAAMERLGGE